MARASVWLKRTVEVELPDDRFVSVEVETLWVNYGTPAEPEPERDEIQTPHVGVNIETDEVVELSPSDREWVEDCYEREFEEFDFESACDDLYCNDGYED